MLQVRVPPEHGKIYGRLEDDEDMFLVVRVHLLAYPAQILRAVSATEPSAVDALHAAVAYSGGVVYVGEVVWRVIAASSHFGFVQQRQQRNSRLDLLIQRPRNLKERMLRIMQHMRPPLTILAQAIHRIPQRRTIRTLIPHPRNQLRTPITPPIKPRRPIPGARRTATGDDGPGVR